MMKASQKGFSTVEILLIVVIIGIVGFAGWYVVQQKDDNKQNPSTQQIEANKTYSDSANIYSVTYPSNWIVSETTECCEGPVKDYTKVSRAINIIPPNVPKDAVGRGVSVQADQTDFLAKHVSSNWTYNKHVPKDVTINGYAAKYVKVEFKGDAESYTDHNYLITQSGKSIFMTFREKYSHTTMTNTDFDASEYIDEFNNIVNSVKFLSQ